MDYFSVPTIEPLDLTKYEGRVGDPILIQAVDDIGLASVEVELIRSPNETLERGKAVETSLCSRNWVYMTNTSVPVGVQITIRVTGTDYAITPAKWWKTQNCWLLEHKRSTGIYRPPGKGCVSCA